MKKLLPLLLGAVFFPEAVLAERPFQQIRDELKRILRKSEADYRLGDRLLEEMRKLAASRKPAFPEPKFVVESQIFRSAKLWYSEKHWRDRALAVNRRYYEGSTFSDQSFAVSYRIMQEYGLDGVNFFLDNTTQDRFYRAAAKAGVDPEKFKIIPTMMPIGFAGSKMPPKPYLVTAANSAYTMRFKGRPLLMGYENDRKTPEANKKFLDELEKVCGKRFAFIIPVAGPGIQVYPDIYFSTKKRVPASILLRFFDHLLDHLEAAEGIEYGSYAGQYDRRLFYDYYDQVLFPLFGAACAAGDFNGNKIFAMKVIQGYTNCNGSQNVDADGTKTLRGMLELCKKHKVDLVCGFEWDENNENTNIEPTVSKPMAHQRIMRYWIDRERGRAPAPRPGDDLSRPNLVVSAKRQLHCGQEYELELLNVPDGTKGTYTAVVRLFDNSGNAVYTSEKLTFDAEKLYDRTLAVPTENFKTSLFLQPEIEIVFKGVKKNWSGLPPTVLRGTASIDYTWFSTPLRNLLEAEKPRVTFTEASPVSCGGIRKTDAEVKVGFSEPVSAAEILQNSQVIYAFDPVNEYRQNAPGKKLFRLSFRVINGYLPITYQVICPGARTFRTGNASAPAVMVDTGNERKYVEGRSCHDELIIIDKDKAADAVLTVRGRRTGGELKGQPFEWRVKLADVAKYGVCSIVFPDSLQLALEDSPKPHRLPLELGLEKIAFATRLTPELPDGVLALRVVSGSGKVWWSRAYALPASGREVPVQTASDRRGWLKFKLPSSRVPDFSYDFSRPETGSILRSAAGRDFYANAGGFVSLATGFEGLIHGFTVPVKYGGRGTAPEWVTTPGGRALKFDGKTTRGLFLPNAAIPQRSGFAVTFDLEIADAARPQILFEQIGASSYLNGFQLLVSNGKLKAVFHRHTPWKPWTRDDYSTFASKLELRSGKRQKVAIRYDGSRLTLAVDGREESFAEEGIAYWLTVSAFGGRDKQRFAGLLYGISIRHSGAPE